MFQSLKSLDDISSVLMLIIGITSGIIFASVRIVDYFRRTRSHRGTGFAEGMGGADGAECATPNPSGTGSRKKNRDDEDGRFVNQKFQDLHNRLDVLNTTVREGFGRVESEVKEIRETVNEYGKDIAVLRDRSNRGSSSSPAGAPASWRSPV